jgi:hypothetical protein
MHNYFQTATKFDIPDTFKVQYSQFCKEYIFCIVLQSILISWKGQLWYWGDGYKPLLVSAIVL